MLLIQAVEEQKLFDWQEVQLATVQLIQVVPLLPEEETWVKPVRH